MEGKALVGGEADFLVGEVEVELGEEQAKQLLRVFGLATNLIVVAFRDEGEDKREVEAVVELAERIVRRDEAVGESTAWGRPGSTERGDALAFRHRRFGRETFVTPKYH